MTKSREEIAAATGLPIDNFHPAEPGLHMEILDTRSMQVWQVMNNVTRDEYKAVEVDDVYRKVGVGALAAHSSFFRRSPGAESDGPMRTLELGGHRWSLCAIPGVPSMPAEPDGPRLVSVDKHHSLVYAEGTELRYLESPEGETYLHVVGTGKNTDSLQIPSGWAFGTLRLAEQTIIDLPCPTSAFFFQTAEGLESDQGPVARPQ